MELAPLVGPAGGELNDYFFNGQIIWEPLRMQRQLSLLAPRSNQIDTKYQATDRAESSRNPTQKSCPIRLAASAPNNGFQRQDGYFPPCNLLKLPFVKSIASQHTKIWHKKSLKDQRWYHGRSWAPRRSTPPSNNPRSSGLSDLF